MAKPTMTAEGFIFQARHEMSENSQFSYNQACLCYIMAANRDPLTKESIAEEFSTCFQEYCLLMIERGKMNELKQLIQIASDAFDGCICFLVSLAAVLYKSGDERSAEAAYRKILSLDPVNVIAMENLENLCCSQVDRWHFIMLNDQLRNDSFRAAINRAIQSGFTKVLDIGSGTGILSMLAAQSAADTPVYGCELDPNMYALSQSVLKLNDMSHQCHVINKLSNDLSVGPEQDVPHKFNVVVTETVDGGLFGESILTTLKAAFEHLVDCEKPYRIIPGRAHLYCQLVQCSEIRKHHRFTFDDPTQGPIHLLSYTSQPASSLPEWIDYDPYTTYDMNIRGGYTPLSLPHHLFTADFNDPLNIKSFMNGYEDRIEIPVNQSGSLDAIIMWFKMDLDEESSIWSWRPPKEPQERVCKCWQPAVYPVSELYQLQPAAACHLKVQCDVGEALCLSVESITRDIVSLTGSERITPDVQFTPDSNSTFYLDPTDVYRLNDTTGSQLVLEAIRMRGASRTSRLSLLDITKGFSPLSLQVYKLVKDNIDVVLVSPESSHQSIYGNVFKQQGLTTPNVVDDLDSLVGREFDLIVCDPISSDGMLRPDVLHDVVQARLPTLSKCSTERLNQVIPGYIHLYAVCIESLELVEFTRLVDDGRTCGLKISDCLNDYQVTMQRDVDMSTLNYRKLTEPTRLMTLDLNSTIRSSHNDLPDFLNTSRSQTVRFVCNDDGPVIHGVAFWFALDYDSASLSTAGSDHYFKQAVSMLPLPLHLPPDSLITLTAKTTNGILKLTAIRSLTHEINCNSCYSPDSIDGLAISLLNSYSCSNDVGVHAAANFERT